MDRRAFLTTVGGAAVATGATIGRGVAVGRAATSTGADVTASASTAPGGAATPFAPGEVPLLPGPCADALARNQRYMDSLRPIGCCTHSGSPRVCPRTHNRSAAGRNPTANCAVTSADTIYPRAHSCPRMPATTIWKRAAVKWPPRWLPARRRSETATSARIPRSSTTA